MHEPVLCDSVLCDSVLCDSILCDSILCDVIPVHIVTLGVATIDDASIDDVKLTTSSSKSAESAFISDTAGARAHHPDGPSVESERGNGVDDRCGATPLSDFPQRTHMVRQ